MTSNIFYLYGSSCWEGAGGEREGEQSALKVLRIDSSGPKQKLLYYL